MKVKSAKAKGRRLQNMIATSILAALRKKSKKISKADVKPAVMGENGPDIFLSSAAVQLFPYSVECKNQEKEDVKRWLAQALKNRILGTQPIVVFKKNRSSVMVALPSSLLAGLMKGNVDSLGVLTIVKRNVGVWGAIELVEKLIKKSSRDDFCLFFHDRGFGIVPWSFFLKLAVNR